MTRFAVGVPDLKESNEARVRVISDNILWLILIRNTVTANA